MLYNFVQASVSRDELKRKLDAVHQDAMKRLDAGGMDRFEADVTWRKAAASLVRESVIDQFRMQDPTPIFVEARQGTQGDTYEFERLINTLRVVEYSPQSRPQIFTPRKRVHTISTSSFEAAWGIPMQKLIYRQHTINEFASMAAEAIQRHSVEGVLSAANTACYAGANDIYGRPLRTVSASADVQKTELDTAIRRMSAYNSGLVIFGSRYALDAIFSFGGGLSENLKDELNSRGMIGAYRGCRIVQLEDAYNEFYGGFTTIKGATAGETVLMEKLVFIASAQQAGVKLEKDLSPLNWEKFESREGVWETGVRMEHGYLMHSPWRLHVIELA